MVSLVTPQHPSLPAPQFWRGKRVLVTGHTGFKGAWLCWLLHRLGAEVAALALAPATQPNLYDALHLSHYVQGQQVDLRDSVAVAACLQQQQPEIILHLAAQALVRAAYQNPVATYASNVMGTVHVLEAMRDLTSLKVALMVTTDKVYQNCETTTPYPETAGLGGHDPYSASKAASEIVIASYRQAFLAAQGVQVVVARAGNVIGGGDWASDRLVPDMIRAWQQQQTVQIRRPDSLRPWQHVLEPLHAYLLLAQAAWDNPAYASAYNVGPDKPATVREVLQLARAAYGEGEIDFASEPEGPHEAGLLALDASKIRQQLGVVPRWDLATSVSRTMQWYKDFAAGVSAADLCDRDLHHYWLSKTTN